MVSKARRRYTPGEKEQLIRNLDIEVEHRVRQLEEWLTVALQNFKLHQEGLVSRIPRLVRSVKMGDFADKYHGDLQVCLRSLQRERISEAEAFEIDRETRKRKWTAALADTEALIPGAATQNGEPARAFKNARTAAPSPKKDGSSDLFSVPRTPRMVRTTPRPKPSSSPHKPEKLFPFVPIRGASPPKAINNSSTNQPRHPRLPLAATFRPTMPAKAPIYPALRAPRRDESMLSVNGSPLANPYSLGLGWFAGGDEDDTEKALDEVAQHKSKLETKDQAKCAPNVHKRVNSIVVRHDPSMLLAGSSCPPARADSHDAAPSPFSRAPYPESRSLVSTSLQPSQSVMSKANLPLPLAAQSSLASALVSLPTRDGRLLEFDPLATSPRALDALVGITDSAKKQARKEMARLVKEAVHKWATD